MTVRKAAQRIDREVTSWPGITTAAHPQGGREYRFGQRAIGHTHGDHRVDMLFPTLLRDEVVHAGLGQPHPTLPDSGWVTRLLGHEPDVEMAIALLRRAYRVAVERDESEGVNELSAETRRRRAPIDVVEQAGRESFPASDPPSWNP